MSRPKYLKRHAHLTDTFDYRIYSDSTIRVWPTDATKNHNNIAGFSQRWDEIKNQPRAAYVPYDEYKKMPKHKDWTPMEAVRWSKKYIDHFKQNYDEKIPKAAVRLLAEWVLVCSGVTVFFGGKNLKKAWWN